MLVGVISFAFVLVHFSPTRDETLMLVGSMAKILVTFYSDSSTSACSNFWEPGPVNYANTKVVALLAEQRFRESFGGLPAICVPFQVSKMALSGLDMDSLSLNSTGVRLPRLECGQVSLY